MEGFLGRYLLFVLCLNAAWTSEMNAFDKSVWDLLKGKTIFNADGKKLGQKFTIFTPGKNNMPSLNFPAFEIGKPFSSPLVRVPIPNNIQGMGPPGEARLLRNPGFRPQIQQLPLPSGNQNFIENIQNDPTINLPTFTQKKIGSPFELIPSFPGQNISPPGPPIFNPRQNSQQNTIFTIAEEEIRPPVQGLPQRVPSFAGAQITPILESAKVPIFPEGKPSFAPFSDQFRDEILQQSLPRDLSLAAMNAMSIKDPFDINQLLREQLQNKVIERKIVPSKQQQQQQQQQQQRLQEQRDHEAEQQQQQQQQQQQVQQQQQRTVAKDPFEGINFNEPPFNIKKTFLEPYISPRQNLQSPISHQEMNRHHSKHSQPSSKL